MLKRTLEDKKRHTNAKKLKTNHNKNEFRIPNNLFPQLVTLNFFGKKFQNCTSNLVLLTDTNMGMLEISIFSIQ